MTDIVQKRFQKLQEDNAALLEAVNTATAEAEKTSREISELIDRVKEDYKKIIGQEPYKLKVQMWDDWSRSMGLTENLEKLLEELTSGLTEIRRNCQENGEQYNDTIAKLKQRLKACEADGLETDEKIAELERTVSMQNRKIEEHEDTIDKLQGNGMNDPMSNHTEIVERNDEIARLKLKIKEIQGQLRLERDNAKEIGIKNSELLGEITALNTAVEIKQKVAETEFKRAKDLFYEIKQLKETNKQLNDAHQRNKNDREAFQMQANQIMADYDTIKEENKRILKENEDLKTKFKALKTENDALKENAKKLKDLEDWEYRESMESNANRDRRENDGCFDYFNGARLSYGFFETKGDNQGNDWNDGERNDHDDDQGHETASNVEQTTGRYTTGRKGTYGPTFAAFSKYNKSENNNRSSEPKRTSNEENRPPRSMEDLMERVNRTVPTCNAKNESDLSRYLVACEAMLESARLGETVRMIRCFKMRLTGEAHQDLVDENIETFIEFKERLYELYRVKPEDDTYIDDLRKIQQQPGEDTKAFLRRAETLSKSASKSIDETCKNLAKREMKKEELLISTIKAMKSGLSNRETKKYLLDKEINDIKELKAKIEKYERGLEQIESETQSSRKRTVNAIVDPTSTLKDILEQNLSQIRAEQAKMCQEVWEEVKGSFKSMENANKNHNDYEKCGEKQEANEKAKRLKRSKACFNCGAEHYARDCPHAFLGDERHRLKRTDKSEK